MGDAQTLRAHGLDVLRPRIDEGDVFAGLRHMRSGIPADRARAHNRYLQAHLSLLPVSISGSCVRRTSDASIVTPSASRDCQLPTGPVVSVGPRMPCENRLAGLEVSLWRIQIPLATTASGLSARARYVTTGSTR